MLDLGKNDLIEIMYWDFVLIFTVLGIALPLLGRRRIRQLMKSPSTTRAERLRLYASTSISQWVAAAFVYWRAHVHGIDNAQLGLEIPKLFLTLCVSVVVAGLILTSQVVSLRKLSEHPEEIRGVLPELAMRIFPQHGDERIAFAEVVLTVAICEEFIFRGFTQYVFQNWASDSVLIGIIGSSLLFSWAHLYQGRRGLISTFIAGLIFSGVRAWTSSLLPSWVAHFAADLAIGYLAPSRFKTALVRMSEARPGSSSN